MGTGAAAPVITRKQEIVRVHDYKHVVEQWLALPHPKLVDQVRLMVRNGGPAAPKAWAAVGAHPVLAARVRGVLSALQAQMADHRDHAMWTVWIKQARHHLSSPVASTEAVRRPPAQPKPSAGAQPQFEAVAAAPVPRTARRAPAVAPMVFLAPGQDKPALTHD